jgi:thioredoxin reductase (NADPH)
VTIVADYACEAPRVIAVHGARRFTGELNLLTGTGVYLTAVVREPGRVIQVPAERLRELVAEDEELSNLLMRAYLQRREILIGKDVGLRLIGSRFSPDSRRLREFLARNRLPYQWIDLEEDEDAEEFLRRMGVGAAETPVVVWTRGDVWRNPSNAAVAGRIGLSSPGPPPALCDVVVVGAGPAGLSAALYGASEGLDTQAVDAVALGGQASTSSRIENYLGFPAGISGSDLAERASVQATRFGVRTVVPANARALRFEDGYHVVELDGAECLRARTVVLATGASYRRLNVARLADFEGAGVYYAATTVEAQMCAGDPVAVVGGGNSAGQAAVFLARHVIKVNLLVRRDDLAATMSRYLIDQIEATPGIELHRRTEVRELHGNGSLDAITVEDTNAGEMRRLPARATFVFIGADPCTGWLADALVTDEDGFVVTGQELTMTHLDLAGDNRQRAPFVLETSRPGVFAVGDVRAGSIKRVASAVGEGAMAVRLAHEYLAALDGPAATG